MRAPLLIQERKGVGPRDPAHLFELLYGNERRERFALSLDHELVVSQGNPVEHVTKPLPNFKGRNFLSHGRQLLQPS
jgi:hypothetical protein